MTAVRYCLASISLIVCTLTLPAKGAMSARPNPVVILCDDLGYGDLGCYGNSRIKTPNLDRMAAEGMRFTDFHVAASVCSPSRAALLTRRYPVRTGVTRVLFPNDTIGLSPQPASLPSTLKKAGYATATVGKWHVGHKPEFLPLQHGFDHYFGIPYSNDMGADPGDEDGPRRHSSTSRAQVRGDAEGEGTAGARISRVAADARRGSH